MCNLHAKAAARRRGERGPQSGCVACGAMRPWHAAARSSAGCARPWHAAARSSAGCAGVCGRYLCASSPLDAVRAACGLEAKRRRRTGRSSIVRGMERLSALRSCTLVSGPLPRLVPRRRRVDGPSVSDSVRCRPPRAANGDKSRVGSGLIPLATSCTREDANNKTAYVRAGTYSYRLLKRHITKHP